MGTAQVVKCWSCTHKDLKSEFTLIKKVDVVAAAVALVLGRPRRVDP